MDYSRQDNHMHAFVISVNYKILNPYLYKLFHRRLLSNQNAHVMQTCYQIHYSKFQLKSKRQLTLELFVFGIQSRKMCNCGQCVKLLYLIHQSMNRHFTYLTWGIVIMVELLMYSLSPLD